MCHKAVEYMPPHLAESHGETFEPQPFLGNAILLAHSPVGHSMRVYLICLRQIIPHEACSDRIGILASKGRFKLIILITSDTQRKYPGLTFAGRLEFAPGELVYICKTSWKRKKCNA